MEEHYRVDSDKVVYLTQSYYTNYESTFYRVVRFFENDYFGVNGPSSNPGDRRLTRVSQIVLLIQPTSRD